MDPSNKLLSFHDKLARFFENYLKTILAFLVIFLIIGILWIGIAHYKSKKEEKASLKLMEITKSSDVIKGLNEIREKYKGTQASFQANLLLFNYYFQENNFKQAQKLVNELKKIYPRKIKSIILYGKAKLLEIQNKYSEALEIYKKILKKEPTLNFLTYLDIARVAEKLGKTEIAKKYYKKYLKNFAWGNKGFVEYKLYQLSKK